MGLFTSQFEGVRGESRAYAGEVGESRFWLPAAAAAGVVAGGAVVMGGEPEEWGDGWEQGWEVGVPAGEPVVSEEAWSDRGEYTDASVGGDGDFFYFIDGDSSVTVG
ncbi:hypothetical protein [Nonomuraea gerenzanensis]|uniref:Uncharacterized protein n=1 Tax=Nonomuraea gerenzanensis TaxID=93944 RepID=A0A1M4E1A1_9ACTN|nr:hypothetical protein [Nonomuraea gerenzanensis]UBU14862.1 hypothetical protein LCN96_07510 [Nonomuraea gerenzanensis]SBO92594.1 hypothetical protein BN4615_P2108 [Nonomuraea gerenzanensis]